MNGVCMNAFPLSSRITAMPKMVKHMYKWTDVCSNQTNHFLENRISIEIEA